MAEGIQDNGFLTRSAILDDNTTHDIVENHSMLESFVEPERPTHQDPVQGACYVDLSLYPDVRLMWPYMEGPVYHPLLQGEEPRRGQTNYEDDVLVFQETLMGNEDGIGDAVIDASSPVRTEVVDHTLDRQVGYRYVDVVVAVDRSGSMSNDQAAVGQIVDQIRSLNPDGHLQVSLVNYAENMLNATALVNPSSLQNVASTSLYSGGSYYYLGLRRYSSSGEEDHYGALNAAFNVLSQSEAPKSQRKQYVFLLTDEGHKRNDDSLRAGIVSQAKANDVGVYLVHDRANDYDGQCGAGDREQLKEIERLQKEAEAARTAALAEYEQCLEKNNGSLYGYQSCRRPYLAPSFGSYGLYAPGLTNSCENYKSLKNLAWQTPGGGVIGMNNGQLPTGNFITSYEIAHYDTIQLTDAAPYEVGARVYHVANGDGAICEAYVDEDVINRAIYQGSLESPEQPEPEPAESTETEEKKSIINWVIDALLG